MGNYQVVNKKYSAYTSLCDYDLVVLYKSGDEKILEYLYIKYKGYITNTSIRFIGNLSRDRSIELDDLISDAYFMVCEAMDWVDLSKVGRSNFSFQVVLKSFLYRSFYQQLSSKKHMVDKCISMDYNYKYHIYNPRDYTEAVETQNSFSELFEKINKFNPKIALVYEGLLGSKLYRELAEELGCTKQCVGLMVNKLKQLIASKV